MPNTTTSKRKLPPGDTIDSVSGNQTKSTVLNNSVKPTTASHLKGPLHIENDKFPKLDADIQEMEAERDPARPKFGPPTKGCMRFHAIRSDGTLQHMAWLLQLKVIFSSQLPKMPPQYITRLIFDPHHISLCLFEGLEPIGGIAFRPFYEHEYAEIAFCAITAKQQIKGWGTQLMNHLKEYVKPSGIRYLITYADNLATGYFRKQGFSKKLTLLKRQWEGFIKQYDGANLMECPIIQNVNYLEVPQMLRWQRNFFYSKVREKTTSSVIYHGLDQSVIENQKYCKNPYSIPGVQEAGWGTLDNETSDNHPVHDEGAIKSPSHNQNSFRSKTSRRGNVSKGRSHRNCRGDVAKSSRKKMRKVDLWSSLRSIYDELMNTRFIWPFKEAVDANEYPEYYEVIATPIDLQIIGHRVRTNSYKSKDAFLAEILLMCNNCRQFNSEPGNEYAKCADRVQAFVSPRVKALSVTK